MFSIFLQPISRWAAGIFCFFRQFSVCFQIFHFIPINYNKEDFHYEHHYRHRPRYYAIKTAHCSFPAGLTSYGEHEPYTRKDS